MDLLVVDGEKLDLPQNVENNKNWNLLRVGFWR